MKKRIKLIICSLFILFAASLKVHAEEGLTVVALGDSTTAGTPAFLSPIEEPPYGAGDPQSQYAYWMMKEHPEWKVLNRGVNGELSDEILRRFERDVLAARPDWVIVLAGVNDLYQGHSVETIQKNLETLYEKARKAGILVIACSILPYNTLDEVVKERMLEMNRWIKEYASRHGLVFCDTFHAIEDPFRPVRLKSSPDGLHPDVEGYRKIGEAVSKVLAQALGKS